jgi:outer membrane protein OmpA-like peptidoglycan-associated protein
MRCHPIRWLWGLIPIAMLSWIAVHAEADRIEHELDQRAAHALHQAGYDWASVVFSGREGVLVGTAPDREEPMKALALVRSLWGVRTVEERVRFAEGTTADAGQRAAPPRAVPETAIPPADDPPAPKRALPPLTSTLALLEPSETKLSVGQPVLLTSSSPAPLSLARQSPDPVRTWEEATAVQATVAPLQVAADAQMTQSEPPRAALETAALAAEAPHTSSVDTCSAAVRAINVVEPVRFAFGASGLDRRNRVVLDRFAVLAGECPSVGLRVVGHADSRGKAKRNLELSKRRARAVVAYLIEKGIDAGRLEAVGYGEARPLAPNDTARNRAKNRRIELEISGTGQGAGNGLPDR